MTQLLNHRYRILKTIGDGGFGQTFLAEDTHLPSARRCVIKQLKPVVDRPQIYQLVKERFQREAAILEELGEGNAQIPKLYAYFETDGLFYLVQEWIDGVTLTQQMQQQGVQQQGVQQQHSHEADVKALLISLLAVLDYIHQRGIIHRDIKPDNIMLRRSTQQPVLIDFGAVKETVQTVLNSQGQPTQSIIIGTPGYMPQEQAVGKPVFASDLYSLGLTAIYLLTGKAPQQLQVHPQTGEYVWQMYVPQISPEFAAVLDRAIQSHARDRYPTAAEMLSDLQASPSANLATTVMTATSAFAPPAPATVPSAMSSTITGSTPPSTPPSDTGQRNNGMILGSLIAGGLIGASVILGLVLGRSSQVPVAQSTPDVANSSPSPVDGLQLPTTSSTASPDNPDQNSPIAIPTPTIPQPTVPTPSLPESTLPPATNDADIVSPNEFAWLATRPVTDADLAGKTAFELDILRNAVFAKHGRRFRDEALQAYFNSRPWYTPIYSPEEFPDDLLSDLEKQNVQVILEYQERNGLR